MVLLLFILVCGRAGSMLLLTALHSKLTDYIILPIRFTVQNMSLIIMCLYRSRVAIIVPYRNR